MGNTRGDRKPPGKEMDDEHVARSNGEHLGYLAGEVARPAVTVKAK